MRMYSTPNRAGAELLAALEAAATAAGVTVMTDAQVTDLYAAPDGRITGVRAARPDGGGESIGCDALILACCGFGGNAEMVRRYIPEIAEAVYHGHPGNQGDAVRWGEWLGAALADLTAYQGHGGLSKDHGIPILWPLIMEGGIQVNAEGRRFSDETTGYSEQAARVNAQPGRFAWSIFDERLHQLMLAFDDYREALRAGAVIEAGDVTDLASRTGVPGAALSETLITVERCVLGRETDSFGRDFTGKPPLTPPYRAAKVTGALFHTQGGLVVDADATVLRPDGSRFPNLFAGGGAARGLSGPAADGYLTGNGLLTATTLGKLAGRAAARLVGGITHGE
jgi:fumarate reductase flavoprotein subunit